MIFVTLIPTARLASRGLIAKQLRLSSTLPRIECNRKGQDDELKHNAVNFRSFHQTAHNKEADAVPTKVALPVAEEKQEDAVKPQGLVHRFRITAEVTISKIFPAGFGWQTASIYADTALGLPADSMAFAVTTGVGDGLGVLAGHTLFYGTKKLVTGNQRINMAQEIQTGTWLGCAALCSGTAWQPLVNALQGANLSFNEVFVGTWLGCGTAFYIGLRLGRTLLHGVMEHVEEPTYENSKNDASLSAVIGGATGFFVGTDAVYLPEQNFLINVVGIQDGTPDILGCAIAGTSTSLGFASSQTALNLIYPSGKCWND